MQHTKCIGIIIRPHPKFSNLDWYTTQIKAHTNQIDNRFELRKEHVYENGYRIKAVVVYAVLSKREVLDKKL